MDYDSASDTLPVTRINARFRIIGLAYEYCCYTKSARGWHCDIALTEKLERAELIALQCILGDDLTRGALNLMRVIQIRKNGGVDDFWKQRHNILYQRKIK